MALTLAGRRDGVLSQARDLLLEQVEGATVVTSAGDAGVESEAQAIVATAAELLGGLDLCVNCAGI